MNDQLQRIYEKRYGTEFTQADQEPYSATTSMLLQAAKEEKERSKRKQKRAKQRQRNQGYVEDEDDADLQLSLKTSKAPRKIEEERRQIWLNIARKDVPRVSVCTSFLLALWYLFMLDLDGPHHLARTSDTRRQL